MIFPSDGQTMILQPQDFLRAAVEGWGARGSPALGSRPCLLLHICSCEYFLERKTHCYTKLGNHPSTLFPMLLLKTRVSLESSPVMKTNQTLDADKLWS